MRSLLHLNSFRVYNLLLAILFSIIVNDNNSFSLIYSSFYCTFHFFLIYLGLYYYRKRLYLIYFLYGLGLDLLWLNEIGPHLLVFMFVLVFFNLSSKYLYNLDSFKIYIVLLWIVNLLVMYQRVDAGCHTIIQVITGDLFGITLGIFSYYKIYMIFYV